jgi:hypothetical protein
MYCTPETPLARCNFFKKYKAYIKGNFSAAAPLIFVLFFTFNPINQHSGVKIVAFFFVYSMNLSGNKL